MRFDVSLFQRLQKKIEAFPLESYCLQSRAAPLFSFEEGFWVKRDDELSFGVSGSKIRKYASLLPALRAKGIQEVLVLAGAHSNHALGVSQMLLENKIKPLLFLRGEATLPSQGNLLWTRLLVSEENIHWIGRADWPFAEQIAQTYKVQRERQGKNVFLLKEGAAVEESLPGACSLPLDILRNERQKALTFSHIFLEAGTGMTAAALLLYFTFIKHPARVHILLLGEKEEAFLSSLARFHRLFEESFSLSCPFPTHFSLHAPINASSFGSTNQKTFAEIKRVAREEGFFIDPLYGAKLFFEARRLGKKGELTSPALLLHSGGALSLSGFTEKIRALTS